VKAFNIGAQHSHQRTVLYVHGVLTNWRRKTYRDTDRI